MKRIQYFISILIILIFPSPSLSKTYHIMLQGFHWESHAVSEGWYNIILENKQRIKDSGFTLIWFPPPSKSVSPQGYEPTQLKKLNSSYGKYGKLKDVISALSPEVKAIADIVINHRSGSTNFADFTNPDWSTHTIVQNDEWFGDNNKSINPDLGDGVPYSRVS